MHLMIIQDINHDMKNNFWILTNLIHKFIQNKHLLLCVLCVWNDNQLINECWLTLKCIESSRSFRSSRWLQEVCQVSELFTAHRQQRFEVWELIISYNEQVDCQQWLLHHRDSMHDLCEELNERQCSQTSDFIIVIESSELLQKYWKNA